MISWLAIISTGLIKSEGRFLSGLEPNRFKLGLPGPYGNPRFDVGALQGGGRAARMLPGSKRDAEIVARQYSDLSITPSDALGAPSASTRFQSASTLGPAVRSPSTNPQASSSRIPAGSTSSARRAPCAH